MTEIILVRHGQTIWNESGKYQGHTDIPLSVIGIEQTYKVQKRLAKEVINVFYASDLQRAYETGRIIAEPHQKEVLVEKELREINFGEWEGLAYNEIMEKYRDIATKFYQDPTLVCIPGGESCRELIERCGSILLKIVEKHPDECVLIASHGGTIRAMIIAAMGWDMSCFWRLRLDNTAICRLEYYDNNAILKSYNDTAHLYY
ncbi:MAG: histidine phosphatase family protein [Zhaonellaceae bacterium]|nr:histidine phosphatase family protein [Clostridia bacterium]